MKHTIPKLLVGALIASACSSTHDGAPYSTDTGAQTADGGGAATAPDGGPGGPMGSDGGPTGSDTGPTTALDAGPVCPPTASAGGAFIHYNQVGYRTTDAKHLYLLTPAALASGATFQIQNGSCAVSLVSTPVGANLGNWNTSFPNVYLLDASAITTAGNYTVTATDGTTTASATFTVGTGQGLYSGLLPHALFFYQAQHDGPNVNPAVLSRKPSHLADEMATVYTMPSYSTDGNDTLLDDLTPAGGSTVDVSGGWFDAGDYIKLVETATYTEAVMLLAVRDHAATFSPTGVADFFDESSYGLTWLLKMWQDQTQTLLYQVAIGDGSSDLGIEGDHDIWRLPEVDDTLQVNPGDPEYYVHYRPAFVAGAAGSRVSPNLAGRLAADFGLCSQVMRATNATLANQCLLAGEHVFALADTNPDQLLTASPYDYYPETAWQDDLELGATELYLALAGAGATPPAGLPETDPSYYLGQAATWADAYVTSSNDGMDSLNLYDVSALGHYELYKALAMAGSPTNLGITQQGLVSDLKAQVQRGSTLAASDPFALGTDYGLNSGDVVPHALGLALSADFYQEISGDTEFAAFGTGQRDYVFGANAWGASYVVGAGTAFPECLQHQVANLSGSLNGTSPILLGAVVDGPADSTLFSGVSLLANMQACPPAGGDIYASFDGRGATYQDNVVDWPTVEPADDYTALTILLFARQ